MDDFTQVIISKITRTEREYANAIAKADEYAAKASEQRQKAEELNILVRHLKQWGTEMGANLDTQVAEKSSSNSDRSPRSALTPVPIRALVREALYTLKDFSSGDLVIAVQTSNADAKKPSILSELSHCKSRKDVIWLGTDRYRSLLYRTNEENFDPFADDDGTSGIQVDADKERMHEPAPGFGKLEQ